MNRTRAFYVGYLPLPLGLGAFVRALVPLVLVISAVGGALAAISQRDPGAAVWDGSQTTIEGELFADPYPHIVTDDGAVVLLVEMGKVGAQERSRPYDRARVRATGWLLRRDGRRVLELDPGEAISKQGIASRGSPLHATSGQRKTLEGEIVDTKCYLGAMKPGDGRAHKSCAVLCVRGGIPPTLITRRPDGVPRYLLVLNAEGGPMDSSLIPVVGETICLDGEVASSGGIELIRVLNLRSPKPWAGR